MSQSPLTDQLILEEHQRREREFRTTVQMSLLGGVIGAALVSLHSPSWLWVCGGFVALSLAWLRVGPAAARRRVDRLARRHGMWSSEMIVAAASALAYTAHQSHLNAAGSRHIDHAARVAAKLAGDPNAQAVAWLHAVLDDAPAMEAEVRAFPPHIAYAVIALTRRAAPSRDWHTSAVHTNPLAAKVRAASDALVAAQKERARLNIERAAQHEQTVGPREEAVVVYEEAA